MVGARPQFVKLAPIDRWLRSSGHDNIIVHTGQHYDDTMSAVFFGELGIPAPTHDLGVGSGSHAEQTGAMLAPLEAVMLEEHPDWVLVYGDTNSTLAGALAAVKIHLPVAHLEAGLRSHNRMMPEEHNRIIADHTADLLLAPTQLAADNLAIEGLADRTVITGDVMADICLETAAKVQASLTERRARLGIDDGCVLATLHRAENTDDRDRLERIIDGLASIPSPVILPVHPRLRRRIREFSLHLSAGGIRPVEPLSYEDLIAALMTCRSVVTDSGGLQKEAYLLGRVCTTLRTETEWPETLEGGWNVLDGAARDVASLAWRRQPHVPRGNPYGSGDAARRCVMALANRIDG